jgi:tetratricopeptide (TPR) repeat protein
MDKELAENSRKKRPNALWRTILLSSIVVALIGLIFVASKINYAEIAHFKSISKPFIDEILTFSNDPQKVKQVAVLEEAVINAILANFRKDSEGASSFFLRAHDAASDLGPKSGTRAIVDTLVSENYFHWHHLAQAEKFSRLALAELPDYASPALRIIFVRHLVTTLEFENKNPEERLALCEGNVQQAKSLYASDSYYAPWLINVLESLGYAYELKQEFEPSRQIFQQQVQLTEATSRTNPLRYGESLMELGRVELACNQMPTALEHLDKAQFIFEHATAEEKTNEFANDYLAIIEYLRCQIFARQGKLDQAATIIRQAIDLSKKCKLRMAMHCVKLSQIDRIRFDLKRSEADLEQSLTICFNNDRSDIEQELTVVSALRHKKTESLQHLSRCLAAYSRDSMKGCNISIPKDDFITLNKSNQLQEQVVSKQKSSHDVDISNFDPPGYFLTGAQFTKLISGS